MEWVTSFLSSLLRRGRFEVYCFEQALTASVFEAEYNCSSAQASSRAASGLRDLMLLSTQHADCMLLGTAKTAAEDLAWHLDMAASLGRHYGRIHQERHADIIAAAPEPEPIQPPSPVHAAAAGSRRTVLFNIIRSRSARRQRLEVWLQQQSDLVTGRTSPLVGDIMQPSQLPGPGLAAGATSRPTSALSSISSRGVAGSGIGGERPPSMVFYANAAFALDGRISPLGDEDVELCPEPGAISRPTSPLSALSSSGGGMAGGGIIGKGSALLPVMFFNPLGEVGDKTKLLQDCFSAIKAMDNLKAKSLRSLKLQRPTVAVVASRPTLLLPSSLPALLPCSSPAVPRGLAPALLCNHLESQPTLLGRSSSFKQLTSSSRSSALSQLSALRLSGASSRSFNSSQPASPADCLSSDCLSSSLADMGSLITPGSASSSRQGSCGEDGINLLAAQLQDSTVGVINSSTTGLTAEVPAITESSSAAEFLAFAEAFEARAARLAAEEDLAEAEAQPAAEAMAAAKLAAAAAAEDKAAAKLAAAVDAISAAALAAAAEALAAEEAMSAANLVAAAEASSAAEATAPKAMQHCPPEATASVGAASPNPKVAQPAGKGSKAGTGKGRVGVKSSPPSHRAGRNSVGPNAAQRSTGNTPTGSRSSSSSSRPTRKRAGAAPTPIAAAGNMQPSNATQSANRARVPQPGSPAGKAQIAAVNVRPSNPAPGSQHVRGSKAAATAKRKSAAASTVTPNKSNVAFGRCVR